MRAAALILELHQRRAKTPPIARLQLHSGQAQVVAEARRFNVLACGRRWGKTELGQDLTVEPLQAGYPVGWFSPNYKDLFEAWDHLINLFREVIRRANKTERRIELTTGGVLECWTLEDPDAGRGRKYQRVIIDEAAKARLLKTNWEQAIRPTLTDFHGDAWFLSTPKGRNYFWQLYNLGQDPLTVDWKSWQKPTISNPCLPDGEAEVESARRELPQMVFEQEYGAQFTESAMLFRNVRGCVGRYEHIPEHRHVAGLDWGRQQDFTVQVTIDAVTKQVAPLYRDNQVAWAILRQRVSEEVRHYGVSFGLAEENSIGSPNLEALQADGQPWVAFTTSNDSKAEIIQALMLAFERQELTIPNDPVLIGELEAFEATRLPSGKWRYAAPEGMHDDTVIALALAWWAAMQGTGMVSQPAQTSRFAKMADPYDSGDGESRWKKF